MLIIPLNLDSVLLLLHNSKLAYSKLDYYGRDICAPQKGTNMASPWPHTKLYKFGWHTSAYNARMKNSNDLILGEVVYISIFYHISVS